jgi:ergothioneine biosynthesis protein EgtB
MANASHQTRDTLPAKAALSATAAAYARVRAHTQAIAAPLSAEDCQVQSMPDASPIKWHLAHTTWFFETFILEPFADPAYGYRAFDPAFKVLFNSYYNAVGAKHPRPERGLLSRPSLERVLAYRSHVDAAMQSLLNDEVRAASVHQLVTLGLNHEQQHQELMLTDLKHMLSVNPLSPVYRERGTIGAAAAASGPQWSSFAGGLVEIGHRGEHFAFDNESPRHQVFLRPYQLANRLVSNRDYLAFIGDGGYSRHELWLSEGWDRVSTGAWRAPLNWREDAGGAWNEFTLHGLRDLDLDAPVCHVSFFEADAYARWADARLPTEAEWEHAAAAVPIASQSGLDHLHPQAPRETGMTQLYGQVWQWTASAYLGYPGFAAAEGAVGEYNGKFMCNQFVLRGSSVATPAGHARATYRNFFQPEKRWQFSGIRLAK